MPKANYSSYENNSYSLYGPVEMIMKNGHILDTAIIKTLFTIVLVIIMIVAVIGNLCTCAVIIRKKSMRTPTNYYLLNLAVTDLFMSFFIPFDVHATWHDMRYPLGEIGCRFQYVCWDLFSDCSLLTITSLTVERYLVVTKPFLVKKLSVNFRVVKIIILIWLISFLFCVPKLHYVFLLEKDKYHICFLTVSNAISVFVFVETIAVYVVPMVIILVVYVLIMVELKYKSDRREFNSPGIGKHNIDRAVLMLAAVALTFFLFWSPYCCVRLMTSSRYKSEEYHTIWKTLSYLCYNAYVSGAVNPILYNAMSKKFRKEFKDLIRSISI